MRRLQRRREGPHRTQQKLQLHPVQTRRRSPLPDPAEGRSAGGDPMTARDNMEAATWEALSRAAYQPPEGHTRKPVDNAFVDAILKAADRYVHDAIRAADDRQADTA